MTGIVVDASLTVDLLLGGENAAPASAMWERWVEEGAAIRAPSLWLHEVTSAVHRAFGGRLISEARALEALDTVFQLEVELPATGAEACRGAFRWASRLGQLAAYDGFYLALAEENRSQLWTGDRRLVRRASQLGIDWVHWVGNAVK